MSLQECQDLVKQVSYEIQKKEVFTSSFFITRLASEVGQVAEKYLREGRITKDIDVDITDIILVCLAYLNWLEEEATKAFAKSLDKYKKATELFKKEKHWSPV